MDQLPAGVRHGVSARASANGYRDDGRSGTSSSAAGARAQQTWLCSQHALPTPASASKTPPPEAWLGGSLLRQHPAARAATRSGSRSDWDDGASTTAAGDSSDSEGKDRLEPPDTRQRLGSEGGDADNHDGDQRPRHRRRVEGTCDAPGHHWLSVGAALATAAEKIRTSVALRFLADPAFVDAMLSNDNPEGSTEVLAKLSSFGDFHPIGAAVAIASVLGSTQPAALVLEQIEGREGVESAALVANVRLPTTGEWAMRPLHIAALLGGTTVIRTLVATIRADCAGEGAAEAVVNELATRTDPNNERGDGEDGAHWAAVTPVVIAAHLGHAGTVAELLEAGADPAACRVTAGMTPLLAAARAGHADVIKTLIGHVRCQLASRTADAMRRPRGRPRKDAAPPCPPCAQDRIVQLLNVRDEDGTTALHHAVMCEGANAAAALQALLDSLSEAPPKDAAATAGDILAVLLAPTTAAMDTTAVHLAASRNAAALTQLLACAADRGGVKTLAALLQATTRVTTVAAAEGGGRRGGQNILHIAVESNNAAALRAISEAVTRSLATTNSLGALLAVLAAADTPDAAGRTPLSPASQHALLASVTSPECAPREMVSAAAPERAGRR